jgi:hypothetical protein
VTWFKVDDGFHSHPKVSQLFEGPCPGDAIALFTIAGSWVSRELTDGVVPLGFVRRSGLHHEAAAELVRVGLWEAREEGGYLIHDYLKFNPDRESVLRDREAGAIRKAAYRERLARGNREASPEASAMPRPGLAEASPSPVPDPVPREELRNPPPARVASDLIQCATGVFFGTEWARELQLIGIKPDVERAAVLAAIRGDPWCKANKNAVDPRHVLKHWAKYAAGNPPLKSVVRAAVGGKYAGPSRVATAEEYADQGEDPW